MNNVGWRFPSVSSFPLLLLAATAAGACHKQATAPVAVPVAPVAPPSAPAPVKRAEVTSRVEVVVNDQGFVPSRIAAKAGQPLTLAITRKTERTCATDIMFAGQEGKTALPFGKTVEVVYTPKSSGAINFGCAMGMMIGGVIEAQD